MTPSERHQRVLLLRLGSRVASSSTHDEEGAPALRRLAGRNSNARGHMLEYAPHAFRCDVEHVPRWIRHCSSVLAQRRGRQAMEEREQIFVAMGFFARIIMRRWRKWSRQEAGVRSLFETLSKGDAIRRWKHVIRLGAFQLNLRHLAMRGAWHRWRLRLQRRAALETAIVHNARNLVSKVWKAWVTHRSTVAYDRGRLREAMRQWREWHKWWQARLRYFHHVVARRASVSAVRRWQIRASTSRSRPRGSRLLLRKCLLALAESARSAGILRRLAENWRTRALRDGLDAWRRWLLFEFTKEKQETIVLREDNAPKGNSRRRRRHRHPGKPRKAHCRCVYAVSRGQRCSCAPRLHLLRRVEELHRLVAKGLDGRGGGYRVASHVVQRTADSGVGVARPFSGRPSFSENASHGSRGQARRYDGFLDDTASLCAQLAGREAGGESSLLERVPTVTLDGSSRSGGTGGRDGLSVVKGTVYCRTGIAAKLGRGHASPPRRGVVTHW